METADRTHMSPSNPVSIEEQLSKLFGSYKAEWLREEMFELFTEPTYYPELLTSRPCMLLGGRGTGKTTVLKCMSYQGQYALKGTKSLSADGSFYGFYYRVNTNRVTAFTGTEVSEEKWRKLFGHYFNLICCDLVVRFLEWYFLLVPNAPSLTKEHCKTVSASLAIAEVEDVGSLSSAIANALTQCEAAINNIADGSVISLSMQGAPIDEMLKAILELEQFSGKNFFFLIDEYENLEDYQQQVINTLIKHAGPLYSFKVGVKELGWRCRTTLNPNEQLISPADYVRIRISDRFEGKRFAEFAKKVCNSRISKLELVQGKPLGIEALLPDLSDDDEADLLDGTEGAASKAAALLEQCVASEERAIFDEMPLLEKYLVVFWARNKNSEISQQWSDYLRNKSEWKERYHNYKHALLYTIRRGKAGIQKYYAGFSTIAQLAGANIRYFVELVDQILLRHVQNGGNLNISIPFKTQTEAAQYVGKKNLSELEGLSVHGAQLTKLLLGLGRIFQILATEELGRRPEVTQFELGESDGMNSEDEEKAKKLLESGVMHLALVRFPGNKLSDETDTRGYDYMVHPIFSAFFVFSFRKKRKLRISASQLLGLVNRPRITIREILAASEEEADPALPEQLSLFRAFYGNAS
jgi:hypothetical protein